MSRVWRTIKGYIFWTYERGSFHYDVMVTLILLFVFLSPKFIDFKDKPASHLPGTAEIVVSPDGTRFQVYQVEAGVVDAQDEGMVRVNFERFLGNVRIERIEAVRDKNGHIVAYRAWVRK